MKHELQRIISGKSQVRNGAVIQATACYLKRSQRTSKLVKESKLYKKQETEVLKDYITKNNVWFSDVAIENYVSEGAEQKVYLKDGKNVIKLNDAIFYNSWEDYLNNLLLHNYFFPDTAYELLGFYNSQDDSILAVVTQPFVRATEKTDLEGVKKFMHANGFINTRNNDYHNPDLCIILEDLHDENVLTENGVLQFIDTVFYIQENFYLD
jgi:Serine/Threonine/Tyrosine Kinase found in polyvalent proteins